MPRIENEPLKYVNAPKEGQKQGSIVLEDGTRFKVKPEWLANFRQGELASFDYEDREFQGTHYKQVTAVAPVNHRQHPEQRPASNYTAPLPNGNTVTVHAKASPKNDCSIFVCALVKAAIESGNINLLDEPAVLQVAEIARNAYYHLFSAENVPY